MIIDIPDKDIESLHHTSMASFYHKQPDRFELDKGSINHIGKDNKGTMLWYDSNNKLDALICFQYYSKKNKCVLLWDMAENPDMQWCLYISSIIE